MKEWKVSLIFTEKLLGATPRNAEVYKTWVDIKQAAQADEEPPPVIEERSWTGFCQDEKGLYILDYVVKGFLKEAASIQPGNFPERRKTGENIGETTIRKRLDNWLFIFPRRIYLGKDKPDGVFERPLRAKTMQGERIALARSDFISEGASIEFTIKCLPDCPIKTKALKAWLDYGALKGLGQFRNGSYGRFVYTLTEVL